MIRSIKLIDYTDETLEALIPIDRVIEIDDDNICNLHDTQIIIKQEFIKEVLNG